MGTLIFITGGARSGKSRFACELASKREGRTAFIATCVPQDDEMKARVEAHRKARPADWVTVEEPSDPAAALESLDGAADTVILDCLTLLVSNLLLGGSGDAEIEARVAAIADAAGKAAFTTIVVSNEVGSGIVPGNPTARAFRDAAGTANRIVAEKAEEAYAMISGIPLRIKG